MKTHDLVARGYCLEAFKKHYLLASRVRISHGLLCFEKKTHTVGLKCICASLFSSPPHKQAAVHGKCFCHSNVFKTATKEEGYLAYCTIKSWGEGKRRNDGLFVICLLRFQKNEHGRIKKKLKYSMALM